MAVPGAGYVARCGIGKEAGWGTLVAPAELIPFISTDIKGIITKASGDSLIGEPGYEDIKNVIAVDVNGSLELYADYQAMDILIALALGGTIQKSGASAPYTHVISLGSDIGRSISIAFDKGVKDFYFSGIKINELTFHSAPDLVTVTCNCVGKVPTRDTTHHSTLVGLSFTLGRRIKHHHAVFRIADCTDVLGSEDEVDVSEFTLTINNNLKVDDRTTGSGLYIVEPIRGGKRTVSISFTTPRFEAETFFAARDEETKLQADIIYTGAALGAGNYTLKFEFPTLKVISCSADISDPGLMPNAVECECYRNNGNTNMSDISNEVRATVQNNRSTDIWGS